MKKQLLTAALIFGCTLVFAQEKWQNIKLPLTNAETGKKITYAIVASKKRGNVSAIENGELEFAYNNKMLADSFFIDATGYIGLKTDLNTLLQQKAIALKLNNRPDALAIKTANNERLNEYDGANVNHWLGFPLGDKPFNYLQLGQVFPNTHEQAVLKQVKFNQLYFEPLQNLRNAEDSTLIFDDGSLNINGLTYAPPGESYTLETSLEKGFMHSFRPSYLQTCKFRLRIYQVDINNQPITELCTTPIIIEREPPVENTNIDLSKYKIALPKGNFMVAVEWVPTRKNINYIFWTKNINPMGQSLRPFIGVSEDRGTQLNVMALDYAGNWKPFDYLSPYYTDLAMECEIGY